MNMIYVCILSGFYIVLYQKRGKRENEIENDLVLCTVHTGSIYIIPSHPIPYHAIQYVIYNSSQVAISTQTRNTDS